MSFEGSSHEEDIKNNTRDKGENDDEKERKDNISETNEACSDVDGVNNEKSLENDDASNSKIHETEINTSLNNTEEAQQDSKEYEVDRTQVNDEQSSSNFEPKTGKALIKGNSFKQWSIASYKCMRQSVFERIGRSSKTVDFLLEEEINNIHEMQRMYTEVLQSVQKLYSHFESLVHSQQALGSVFHDLLPKSPELEREISSNVKTQQSLSNNGQLLLSALSFFINSLNTLCNKTIADTLATAKQYELVRLEYDAYRNDFESLTLSVKGKTKPFQVEEARQRYLDHKEIFERIRADVHVKIKFLENNRINVMQKLMVLLHNSILSYFTGNQTDLETTLKQFGIKIPGNSNYTPASELGSWLELK